MPRYPFQPDILDALPEELCELFRSLELTLLEEICSRLKIADQLNEVTVQDIRALRAHGIDLEEIKAAIAEATGTGADKLEALLDDVVERNQTYYTSVIDLAQVTAPQRLVDEAAVAAIRRQTLSAYRNITGSMGFLVVRGGRLTLLPPAQAYQWALDSAELQIQSGAISYTQTIGGAVKQLAERGVCVAYDESGNTRPNRVAYESGHIDHLDVAVRRAVMTGVNQLNQQYREQSMDYLETDLVEVTAHSGARDTDGPNGWENHKRWQGKVYRWSAKPKTAKGVYPDFAKTCGYGSVTGIGGANCRHSWWPFVEGVSERACTDGDLAAIDPEPFRYEGRTYTAYQATQKQREIERTVRKLERAKAAYAAAGLTDQADAASIRLGRLKKEYRRFSRAAGLKEQRERMRVLYQNGPSARNTAKILEKRTRSGIIKAVGPKEVPDVGKKSRSVPKDVTAEYLRSATPGSHLVKDLRAYTVGGTTYTVDGRRVVLDHSPHEKEVAELLERTLGGEIFMVPRVNAPQGVSTPDYLIRGKGYDLKTIGRDAGPKTIWNRVKKAKRQAHNFIIDVTEAKHLTDETISKQLEKIFQDDETLFVDEIILIRDGMIAKIVKRV